MHISFLTSVHGSHFYEKGMLDEYYHYRGCSSEGLPTRKRLKEVGLSDTIEDLIKKGRLAEHECPDIKELLPKTTKS